MFSKEEDKMVNLGFNSINDRSDEGVNQALNFLTEICTGYLNKKRGPEAEKMVVFIKEIGKAAALKGMENAAVNAIRALEKVLQCSIEQNMQGTTVRVLLSFGAIGKTAAEQHLEMVAKLAASVLGKSGNTAALLNRERETIAVVIGLGEIGKAVARIRFPDISENAAICISCLGDMGKLTAQKSLEEAAVGVELMFEEMAVAAMQENLQNTVRSIATSIEEIRKNAEEEYMENAVFQAASALQTIMSNAGNRYLNDASIATKVALESFNELDIINDEANIKKIEEIREMMRTLWVDNEIKK
ncbi:hypothetical protein RG963_02250 [Methanosarcina sp. Z-7115]|uniref:Uncharacterized protein n=1 Tax=Methanosarcina baikalica TaxID=3073890 RepID=A0ABU2CY09_9EURY|nr:hypothetical protein [Methanosarcina sp. Z-7115]MDR7664625.1 hypothetical protein [Methanosarcina sp. Z-7115]